jgi:hypothetical protein
MPNVCPECAAILDEDTSCQAIFEAFLVLEYTDPGYGEVHMLTVACFMIQHGRYSDEALVWMAQKLRAYLEEGVSAEQLRQQATKEADQGKRTWKVTRQPDARKLPEIAWSMTIADVAAHYQDAGSYRDLVRQWAWSTLQEMRPFISSSS